MMRKLLAAVVALAMVLSMSVTAFAGEYSVSVDKVLNTDGTVTVTVYANGNLETFDIGVVYTNAVATDVSYVTNFRLNYLGDNGMGVKNPAASKGGETYVVVTGAKAQNSEWNGAVFTVTFSDVTAASTMRVLKGTASVKDDLSACEVAVETQSILPN